MVDMVAAELIGVPVVVMTRVVVIGVVPSKVEASELIVQVLPVGAPAHSVVTLPFSPLTGVRIT